jgi:SAM-dependent methyltransferase
MFTVINPEQSHRHAVETLTALNRYQDFMDNIKIVADMGCGTGLDAEWWGRLTKDDGTSRNIQVNAIDRKLEWHSLSRNDNINYIEADFSTSGLEPNSHDLVWAHNSLQYSLSPIGTLIHWHSILKPDGMLLVTVPFNFKIYNNKDMLNVNSTYTNGCYFNWTMGNLIMTLVGSGFDCRNGHFKIDKVNNWIQASVYKLPEEPNPYMNWYEMCDRKLLPLSVENSIMKTGNFDDIDIVVEWIDRTQYMLTV